MKGQIMAIEHKEYQVHAVQFHPESILTPSGKKMLANWLGVSWEFKPEEKMY
jgi:anthranilate synthase component 2